MSDPAGYVRKIVKFGLKSVTIKLHGDSNYCVLKPHKLVTSSLCDTPWSDIRSNSFPIVEGAYVRLRKSAKQAPGGRTTWYDLDDLNYTCASAESAKASVLQLISPEGWLHELLQTASERRDIVAAARAGFSKSANLSDHLSGGSSKWEHFASAASAIGRMERNVRFGGTLMQDARRLMPSESYDPQTIARVASIATEHGVAYAEFRENPLKTIKKHSMLKVETPVWKFTERFSARCGVPQEQLMAEWVDSLMLEYLHDHGHMYLPLQSVQEAANRKGRRVDCFGVCSRNAEMFRIVDANVYRAADYHVEAFTARMLAHMSKSDEEHVELTQGQLDACDERLTDEQMDVVRAVVERNGKRVVCVAGFPGVGKSLVVKSVCAAWKHPSSHESSSVLILTPTGKATDRLRRELEDAPLEIMTIHRALADSNPTDNAFSGVGLVVVDEMSMVDAVLFRDLLRACRNTQLLLLGDPDQLPSIDRGDVFTQLLKPEAGLPVIRLTRRFRSKGSIVELSDAIRGFSQKQSLCLDTLTQDGHVVFVDATDPPHVLAEIARIYEEHPGDTQVLVPCNIGAVGTYRVNYMIHGIEFGEPHVPERVSEYDVRNIMCEGDKIVVTKNDPARQYFNGQIGTLHEMGEERVSVLIDGTVEPVKVPKEDVTMAYAISVHKSQGSEYDVVILVLHPSHGRNLMREILYTAVTRAKHRLYVISSEATLEDAARNVRFKRNTRLANMVSTMRKSCL